MNLRHLASAVVITFLVWTSPLGQTRPSGRFDQAPFDVTNTKLPPKYLGHSLLSLPSALVKWTRISEKGEFETTAAYENRISQHRRALLYGQLRFDDLMAFSIGARAEDQLTAIYDADRAIMTVSLQLKEDVLVNDRADPVYTVPWTDSERTYGSYVGRNIFNRAARVRIVRRDFYYLGVSQSELRDFHQFEEAVGLYRKLFAVYLKMDAHQARDVKPRLRALMIGRLSAKPYSYYSDRDTPTIDNPYDYYGHYHVIKIVPREIWVYDIATGEVYAVIIVTPKEPVRRTPPDILSVGGSASILDELSSLVLNPKDVDVKARILSRPEPQMTEEARQNQISGTVVLRAVFRADGKVTDIRVVSGLPHGLSERAVEAAKQIRFTPAMKNGKTVSQNIQLEYNFNLY